MTIDSLRKYTVAAPEDLRALCIKNNWFTCGNGWQYDKLFFANKRENGFTLHEIAIIIWLCSDAERYPSEVKGIGEIEKILEDLNEDYLLMLAEAQVAEGERDADEMYLAKFD